MRQLVDRHLRAIGIAVFVVLLVGGAQATPVHYSEAVSGDLAQTPNTAFDFDIGNNTISGATHFLSFIEPEPNCHFCSDFDSFTFNLPSHTALSSIALSWDLDATNVRRAESDFGLCAGAGDVVSCFANSLGSQSVDWLGGSPLAIDFEGALPIGSGTYTVRNTSLGIGQLDSSHGVGMGWTADYKWTFRVTSIPEPSTLPLLAMALGAFGLVSLRQRS